MSAPLALIWFVGKARSFVLFINLSVSLSYHMFSAPDAPEPIEIARIASKPVEKLKLPGAIIIPTKLVNIESDMTLGLSKEMYRTSFVAIEPSPNSCLLETEVIFAIVIST